VCDAGSGAVGGDKVGVAGVLRDGYVGDGEDFGGAGEAHPLRLRGSDLNSYTGGYIAMQDMLGPRFLGRERELIKLHDLLLNKRKQLVVVQGEPGSGKTTFARAFLNTLDAETFWLSLHEVTRQLMDSATGHLVSPLGPDSHLAFGDALVNACRKAHYVFVDDVDLLHTLGQHEFDQLGGGIVATERGPEDEVVVPGRAVFVDADKREAVREAAALAIRIGHHDRDRTRRMRRWRRTCRCSGTVARTRTY